MDRAHGRGNPENLHHGHAAVFLSAEGLCPGLQKSRLGLLALAHVGLLGVLRDMLVFQVRWVISEVSKIPNSLQGVGPLN